AATAQKARRVNQRIATSGNVNEKCSRLSPRLNQPSRCRAWTAMASSAIAEVSARGPCLTSPAARVTWICHTGDEVVAVTRRHHASEHKHRAGTDADRGANGDPFGHRGAAAVRRREVSRRGDGGRSAHDRRREGGAAPIPRRAGLRQAEGSG